LFTQVSKVGVFLAASGALVLSTLIAVLVGSQLSQYISPRALKIMAGVGFIVIGTWVLWSARV